MHYLKKLIYVMIPVALLVSIRLHIVMPCEGDKGWLLHAAHMWLAGSRLYVTVFEVNPPLIVWLYAIPVWVSLHIPWITDYQALAVLGLVASFYASWLGMRLIALHPAFEGDRPNQIKFFVLQLLIFIFFTTESYFFDREHIIIVLGFPYMIRFMPQLAGRPVPRWLSVNCGVLGAVAFCIKPHAVLIFLALQLFTIFWARSIKAVLTLENYIVAGLAVFYALLVFVFTPEYFRDVVPMAFYTYSTFRNENAGYAYLPPFFIGFGLIFADFRPWQQTPYRKDVYYMAWLCLVFLAYAKINNGWGYTFNPLYCVFMLTAGWLFWEYDWLKRECETRELSARNVLFGLRGCFIVFMAHSAYMLFYLAVMNYNLDRLRSPCYGNPDCYRNSPYVSYFMDHDIHSFGTLSFDFSNWVSLMRLTNTDWNTRFNHLWMLPKLMLEGEDYTQKRYWIVEFVAKGLAEDMNNKKPQLMIVDSGPGLMGLPHRFNLIEMFSKVPEFREAWTHYHYSITFNGCGEHYNETASECRYDVYTRVP